MQLIRQLPIRSDHPSAVAIGNFDGLHLGHQAVIGAMVEAAQAHQAVPSVLTFEPHPRRFFAPDIADFRISRLSDKCALLRDEGVAQLVMPRFDRAFANMSAEAFLDDVLGQSLGAKAVVTGENFAFGHQRRGDSAMLKAWGVARGVEIITVAPVRVSGVICSSSAVRASVAAGDMPMAAQLLGRPYRLSGRVVHGDGRGRTIGFPTANVSLPPGLLLPAYGVYAVRAVVDGVSYPGVANLGIRPTVSVDKRLSLEVHLFDVVQEIYGKKLQVSFVHNIRNEMKFAGVEALTAQIAKDCETARVLLGMSA
jgi:riboflavin kinase/FMN adenylyltransferase